MLKKILITLFSLLLLSCNYHSTKEKNCFNFGLAPLRFKLCTPQKFSFQKLDTVNWSYHNDSNLDTIYKYRFCSDEQTMDVGIYNVFAFEKRVHEIDSLDLNDHQNLINHRNGQNIIWFTKQIFIVNENKIGILIYSEKQSSERISNHIKAFCYHNKTHWNIFFNYSGVYKETNTTIALEIIKTFKILDK